MKSRFEIFRISFEFPKPDIVTATIGLGNSQFGTPILVSTQISNARDSVIRVEIDKQRTNKIYVNSQLVHSYRWNAPVFLESKIEARSVTVSPDESKISFALETQIVAVTRNWIFFITSVLSLAFLALFVWRLLNLPRSQRQKTAMLGSIERIAIVGLLVSFASMTLLKFFDNQSEHYFDKNGLGFAAAARYSDWFQLSGISRMAEPYRIGHSNYPPAFLGLFKIISFLGPTGCLVIAAVIACAAIASIISWPISGGDTRRFSLSLLIVGLSYPLLFAIDRGSSDLIMAPLIAVFIYLLKTSRPKHAAAVLGVMIALKIFPVLFIPLLLKKGKAIQSLRISFMAASISTVAGAFFLSGSLRQIVYFVHESISVQNAITSNQNLAARSTSISQWAYNLKSFRVPFASGAPLPDNSANLVTALVVLLIAITVMLLFNRTYLPSEKLMLFMIIALLANPISNDYRLLLLMPVLAFWIYDSPVNNLKKHTVISCGILFAVRPILWVTDSAQTLGGLFTMPILVVLFIGVIRNRLALDNQISTVQHPALQRGI